jgi:type III secretion system YscI/HrpB-like protein
MKIEAVDITAPAPSGKSAPTAINSGDVSWFNAQLQTQPAAQADENNVASRIIGSLSQRSDELQRLNDRANRDLVKATRTADPQDLLQANRSMSSFYLESLMTAKMVSKGSQAIEKLTNLQ